MHKKYFEYDDLLSPSIKRASYKTVQKTIQKTAQKQEAIFSYLKEHPEVDREEMAQNIEGVTASGIKYNLKVLQEKGFLKRIGSDKGGHWEVQ